MKRIYYLNNSLLVLVNPSVLAQHHLEHRSLKLRRLFSSFVGGFLEPARPARLVSGVMAGVESRQWRQSDVPGFWASALGGARSAQPGHSKEVSLGHHGKDVASSAAGRNKAQATQMISPPTSLLETTAGEN